MASIFKQKYTVKDEAGKTVNLPVWAEAPVAILVFTTSAAVGFLFVWIPCWVITHLFEDVPENNQSEKAKIEK
jgi:hypothetical protein